MFSWYGKLTGTERRTFWACYSGWALDALDAQMYSLVIPAVIAAWSLSKAEAGSVGSVSLIASAIGGWFFGALTDRYGRTRVLQLTILCFSVFTFLSAFAQNLPQLLVLKALQGLGFGGEWAVGAALISEAVRDEYRGRVMGTIQSGWAVGWGLAVVLFGAVFSVTPENGWRWMFGLGLVPALLVLFIRRSVPEPLRQVVAGQKTPARGLPLWQIFSPEARRTTLIGGLFGLGAHGGYHALMTWLPTYLKSERKLSVLGTSGYLAVIIVAFWLGCVCCAHLLDRLGRRRTVVLFSASCVATVSAYLLLDISDRLMLVLGFPLGFFAAGIPASMGPVFSELYPSGIRGTGVGFCYNAGRVLSAAFPFLVGKLSGTHGLGWAIGVDAAAAYSLVAVAAWLLPGPQAAPKGVPLAAGKRSEA
jgi:MFS family permease